jgi:hypothetical protein
MDVKSTIDQKEGVPVVIHFYFAPLREITVFNLTP